MFLPCETQKRTVLEYYLPVYEIVMNKAGARVFDVTMFRNYDNDQKYLRSKVSELHEKKKEELEQALQQAGIDTKDLKWPDYEKEGEEPFLQRANESFSVTDSADASYPIGFQTNVHVQATRNRPDEYWKGWAEEPESALWCFNNPEKKIVTNSMDHGDGIYWDLSTRSEDSHNVWPQASEAILGGDEWKLSVGERESDSKQREDSFRMQKFSDPFNELKRVGRSQGGEDVLKKVVFWSGEIWPPNQSRFNSFTDPVVADVLRGVTAALLFGSKKGALKAQNTDLKRHLQMSYMKKIDQQDAKIKDKSHKEKMVFADLVQVAYPPIEMGDPRTGSECFRPENLASILPGKDGGKTSKGHYALPKDLRKRTLDTGDFNYANETRIIIWTKRIMCACEKCGIPYGCNTLDRGDDEETELEGIVPQAELPSPLKEALPYLRGYAEKTEAPKLYPKKPDIWADILKPDGGGEDGGDPQVEPGKKTPEDQVIPDVFTYLVCLVSPESGQIPAAGGGGAGGGGGGGIITGCGPNG
jgi:hypothetical protein